MAGTDPLDKIRFDSARGFVSPHWTPLQRYVPEAPYANMRNWGSLYNPALPEQLGGRMAPSMLEQVIRNLQVSGEVGQTNQGSVSGYAGSGRIGYGMPMDDGYVSVGTMMGGYRAKGDTPQGPINKSDLKVQGMDASYSNRNGTFGVNYERQPMGGKQYNLFYSREF